MRYHHYNQDQQANESLRADWEFEYPAATLADAAREQRDYHAGRVEVWKTKYNELKRLIESKGMTVQETLADQMQGTSSMSFVNTRSAAGPQVVMDPEVSKLTRELNEASAKVKAREASAREYDAWEQMLSDLDKKGFSMTLKLKHDDWMFFFGN